MGVAARERHPLRHQGRDLPGPHRGHEPVEVGACRRDHGAHAGRGAWTAPTCSSACRSKGALTPEMIASMAQEPDHLRHGQSRSGDHAGGGRTRCATTPSSPPAARTTPTRSTTSSASPTSSAARSTCAPPPSTMDMKIAAAEALAELAPRGRAGRGGRRLSGRAADVRPRLHHPGAVRSAADLRRSRRGGARRRWIRGVARKPIVDMDAYEAQLSGAARSRSPAALQRIFERVRRDPKRVVFAEGEEEQVDPRRRRVPCNQGSARPILVGREDDLVRRTPDRAASTYRERHRDHQRAPRRTTAAYADFLYDRLQRQGYLLPRLPAPGQHTTATSSPPAWWRWAMPTPW